MTPHTKKWLILAGAGVAGFILWQRFGRDPARQVSLDYLKEVFNMQMPATGGLDDAMNIIDDMLQNNPLRRPARVEVTGINQDAPKIYL